MATLSTVGLHFPEATPNGLFGVGHTRNAWFVVNKITGQAKRIGQVGGRINYFGRAIEEADRRNKEYEVDELDEGSPLWLVNEQIKGLLEGDGASEDHEDVIKFFRATGLPRTTVDRIHKAIVCAEVKTNKGP